MPDDQRDRAGLQAGQAGEVGPAHRLAQVNGLQDDVPVDGAGSLAGCDSAIGRAGLGFTRVSKCELRRSRPPVQDRQKLAGACRQNVTHSSEVRAPRSDARFALTCFNERNGRLFPRIVQRVYVPLLGECVRMKDRDGLYTVRQADYRRQTAELTGDSGRDTPIKSSFVELFAAFEDPAAPPPRKIQPAVRSLLTTIVSSVDAGGCAPGTRDSIPGTRNCRLGLDMPGKSPYSR